MRRMKIRATPNFGGGGAAVQRNMQQPRNKSFSGNPLAETSGGNMASEESSTSMHSPTDAITVVQEEEEENNITKVTSTLDLRKKIVTSSSSNFPEAFEKQEMVIDDAMSHVVQSVPSNDIHVNLASCSSNIFDTERLSHDLCKGMNKGEAASFLSDTKGLHSIDSSEVVDYLPNHDFSVKKCEDSVDSCLRTGASINGTLISDYYHLSSHESAIDSSASCDGPVPAEAPEELKTHLENKLEGFNLSAGHGIRILSKQKYSSAFSVEKGSSPISLKGTTRRSRLHAKPFLSGTIGKKSLNEAKIETVDLVSTEDTLMNKGKKSPGCAISEAYDETDNISDIYVDNQYSPENVAIIKGHQPQLFSTSFQTEKGQIDSYVSSAERQNVCSASIMKKTTSSNQTLSSTIKSVSRRSKIQARPSLINVAGKNSQNKYRTEMSSSLNKTEEFVKNLEEHVLSTNKETPATKSTGENKSPNLLIAQNNTSQFEKEEVTEDGKNYVSSPSDDRGHFSDLAEAVVRKLGCLAESSLASAGEKKVLANGKDIVGKEVGVTEEDRGMSVNIAESATLVHVGNNVRRSKIRAKPAFISKRKVSTISEKDIKSENGAKQLGDGDGMNDTLNITERVEEQVAPNGLELLVKTACEENENFIPEVVHTPKKPPNDCHNTDDVHKTPAENRLAFEMKTHKSPFNRRNVNVIGSGRESGDDKENSSKVLHEAKAGRKEHSHGETTGLPTYCRTRGKAHRGNTVNGKRSIGSEKNWKESAHDNQMMTDVGLEEKNEKQIFRDRKEKYRRKISHGNIEREKMTMFDLIFWNPVNNPMPGRTDPPKKKLVASCRSEIDDMASDVIEEEMVDDAGLDVKASVVECDSKASLFIKEDGSREESSASLEDAQEGDGDAGDEEEIDVFAPQVKIGPDGRIILDERSIKIQTTAAKNRDEILSRAEVVEETNDTAHYGKWSKKRRRSCEWTVKETARFYRALSTVGTDFSLMETLFKWRSRAELKTKFKKEERTNRDLVDRALKDYTQFDFSLFNDESDYDPEEDRKATRIAERAEAKRRRLEMKRSEKEQEKCGKKKALKEKKLKVKARKSLLRKMRNDMKSKHKTMKCEKSEVDAEDHIDLGENETENKRNTDGKATSSVSGKYNIKIESGNCVKRKQPSHLKKINKQSKSKLRSPLEISEIVVTMETKKGIDQARDELLIADFTVDEMTDYEDQNLPQSPLSDPIAVGDFEAYGENPVGTELVPITLASEISESKFFGNGPQEYTVLSSMSVGENMCSMDSYSPPLSSRTLQNDDVMNKASTSSTRVVITDSLPREHFPQSLSNTQILSSDVASEESFPDQEIYSSQFSSDSVPGVSSQDISMQVTEEEQKVWEFPLTAVELHSDGRRTISVPTITGQKSLPIPYLPPGTSGVMVVATSVPDSPGEYIYHVYTISPSGS